MRVMGVLCKLCWKSEQGPLSVYIENSVGGEGVKASSVFLESVRKRRKDEWTGYGIFHC